MAHKDILDPLDLARHTRSRDSGGERHSRARIGWNVRIRTAIRRLVRWPKPRVRKLGPEGRWCLSIHAGISGFFLACGGVGSPSFGCGLASDFYDQLADRFDLPQQEVRDPAQFRAPAAAQLDQYKNLLDDFKIKERVCVSVNFGFKTIKRWSKRPSSWLPCVSAKRSSQP